jgi:hypothetical protein
MEFNSNYWRKMWNLIPNIGVIFGIGAMGSIDLQLKSRVQEKKKDTNRIILFKK